MPKISENCAHCGETLERYIKPSRMATHRRVFCDRKCHAGFFRSAGNPMKDCATRKKASFSAKKRFEDPMERERNRNSALKRWADGVYDGVRVGQCHWHELTLRDGSTVKLQGTWELKYARWLDSKGIAFEAHRGRIPYTDDSGVQIRTDRDWEEQKGRAVIDE